MAANLVKINGTKLSFSVEIDLSGSMLSMEEQILTMVNDLGSISTQKALELCDNFGQNIIHQGGAYSSKGKKKR